jgi:membrane-associated phospholipid phosphatase
MDLMLLLSNMMVRPKVLTVWICSAAACLLATAIAFAFVDDAVMRVFSNNINKWDTLGQGLGTTVALSVDAAMALTLVLFRIVRGRDGFSPLYRALVLACLTSICAYAVNDGVLKLFFGVPNPASVFFQGARHGFHLFAGSQASSFPSGHMMLVSPFAGVLMKLYPRTIVPLAILLLIAAVALIVGDWHFVSDVIAGTSLGVAIGLLVGNLWLDHTNNRTAA